MAKVTGPLMSLDASGTVAKTVVFSKWNGQNYVRHHVIPKNPQTAGQAQSRQYVGATGFGLSFILTKVKDTVNHVGSAGYQAAYMAAPPGQSWISNAVTKILGTDMGTITANLATFAGLAAVAALYETAGGNAGMSDFNLSYGELDPITKGAILYLIAKFAETNLGYAGFAGGADDATAPQLVSFVTYLETTSP